MTSQFNITPRVPSAAQIDSILGIGNVQHQYNVPDAPANVGDTLPLSDVKDYADPVFVPIDTSNLISAANPETRPAESHHTFGLYTEEEFALMFGRSVQTVAQWRKEGLGPDYTMVGKSVYYRWRQIDAWLDRWTFKAGTHEQIADNA